MDQTDEIKKKIDVVDLISSYLTLQKAGRNFRACCPFHKEKTPSFMVSSEKQIWYCFGCNQGGDIFSFIERMEGLDFVGALNLLADRAGVILERQRGGAKKSEKDKYFEMTSLASKFFSYILWETKAGEEARKYLLEKRGLTAEIIKEFGVGYSPDQQTLLHDFLAKKDFKDEDMLKIGLITRNTQGRIVDKFRDRIIFPIYSVAGKVVGFGGRIFHESKNPNFTPPKYLNSPQSDIYDKSSTLYGLYQAKEAIREKDLAIVVEGYMDVISSHQAGVKNVVASSGTALTAEQVVIASRYASSLAFSFDTDQAGQMALKRALDMTRYEDVAIKAIAIKEGKDPDDLIKISPKKWEEATANPVPILEFFYQNLIAGRDLTQVEEKKKVAKEFLPILAVVSDNIEKAYWIKKISNDLAIGESYIQEALNKAKIPLASIKKEAKNTGGSDFKVSKELLLLGSLILFEDKRDERLKRLQEANFLDDKAKNIYKAIVKCHNQADSAVFSQEMVKNELSREDQEAVDMVIFLTTNLFESIDQKSARKDMERLFQDVLQNDVDRQKKDLEREIGLADKVKDKEKVKGLLRKLQELI